MVAAVICGGVVRVAVLLLFAGLVFPEVSLADR